ncbi:MAG: T9SS type A sorting domain-containing protein [Flavobacteriales bacterium]|nr:T9SS type A sorting domain-containing protein [Flavobacteriales bacterium]
MKKKNYFILLFICFIKSYSQNDLCSNAIALTPAIECNLITGTFSGSGISSPAPSCGSNSSQDVWYQFVATDPTMSVYISPANGVNHGFQIIQNNCNGTIVACQNSNTTSTSESYIGNSFVVGETYLIRVFNASANLTTASFNICVQDANLNSNDFTEAVYSIFPNPAQNEITIHSQDDILNITCFDVLGKKIRVFQISDLNSINISDLGSGLYFLKLTFANGKTVTSKLIKN